MACRGADREGAAPPAAVSATAPAAAAAAAAAADPSLQLHSQALSEAMAREEAARELALRDPSRVTDEELRLLLEAIRQYEAVIEATQAPAHATGAPNHAHLAAWHGVARCEFRIGRFWVSFQALEKSYPAEYDEWLVTALAGTQSMLADQLFRRGHARVPGEWGEQAGAAASVTGYRAARDVYRAIVVNHPRHPLAARALVRYGICAYELADFDGAENAFRQVIHQFGRGEAALEARTRLAGTLLRRHRGHGELPPGVASEIDYLLAEAGFDSQAAADFKQSGAPGTRDGQGGAGPQTAHGRETAFHGGRIDPPGATAPALASDSQMDSQRDSLADSLARLARDRDEQAAGVMLAQAQRFLRIAGAKAKNSAKFQLTDLMERYPETEAAAIADSLLRQHFSK